MYSCWNGWNVSVYCMYCINKFFFSLFFCKSHKITGALYDSLVRFYVFRWKLTKGFDQDKLTEYLPSSLVGDISTVLYADFIAKVKCTIINAKITIEWHVNYVNL